MEKKNPYVTNAIGKIKSPKDPAGKDPKAGKIQADDKSDLRMKNR